MKQIKSEETKFSLQLKCDKLVFWFPWKKISFNGQLLLKFNPSLSWIIQKEVIEKFRFLTSSTSINLSAVLNQFQTFIPNRLHT